MRKLILLNAVILSIVFIKPIVFAYEVHNNGWIWPAGTSNTGGYKGWHEYTGHIGTDFKLSNGSPVYAITHGEIISHSDNLTNYGSACGLTGGAILVRHWCTGQDGYSRPFYALYGHCHMTGDLHDGDIVLAGETIGTIHDYWGDANEDGICNDDWDHLHFGIRPDQVDAAKPYRGVSDSSTNDYGWVNPLIFMNENYPGPAGVTCNQINNKFPDLFGQYGILLCSDVTFEPPNMYSINYYFNNETTCSVALYKLLLTMNNIDQSIVSAITTIEDDGTGGYGGGGSVYGSGSSSSSKPDLYVSELTLRNGKRSYYDDETIHVDGYVTNGGVSVSSSITRIDFNLYRFRGEHINDDLVEEDNENIKGENLGSGETKHEEFEFGAPNHEDMYQIYAVIDDNDAVDEASEDNNKTDNLIIRVHNRPDLIVTNLASDDGRTLFDQGENPMIRATITNLGGEPFRDVPVIFYLDGIRIDEQNMRHWNIENGDIKHESTYLNTFSMSLGTHVIKACADFSEDDDQSDNCMEITFEVIKPPDPVDANFSFNPASGLIPLLILFTDTSTGTITSWSWDFGDGFISSDQNSSHTYTSAGIYTVTLTVAGPIGSSTKTSTISVFTPAIADFVPSLTPPTACFTDASTGTISSWLWDFGDGATSSEQNPCHTYATDGTYIVTLNVNGPSGSSTNTTTITILTRPTASFNANHTSGEAPLTVSFTDTSTGNIIWRGWNFGDGGTSTEQNPSHIYVTPGTYAVTLTVEGLAGISTKTTPITVYAPIDANFIVGPNTGVVPWTVNFTDVSTGIITSWLWDFGDGGTSSDQNPTHTFTVTGTYLVRLTVNGPYGSSTNAAHVYVIEPITTDFSANPTSGMEPLSVSFTNQSSGAISSWFWNFGDGASSDAMNPTHTYSNAGTYTVSLTATGPDGSDTETKVDHIKVTASSCECDLNTDGRCDMRDWLLFGRHWGSTTCNSSSICECDLNHDGRCDMRDWLLFGQDWGRANCPVLQWAMFGHDRQHTGRSPYVGAQTANEKWAFNMGYVTSSPAIGADGTVYIGSSNNKVYALDGETGSQKWDFNTGSYVHSSPAIGADGTLYVGSHDGRVYALDGATGSQKWAFTTGQAVYGSPAIGADGTVYIGSWDNKIYALNSATGSQRWAFTMDGPVYSSPSIGADGTVYIGNDNNKVYALDGATGSQKWVFTTDGYINSSPSIGYDGTVYVGSFDGNVYALDGATGSQKWVFTTGGAVESGPATDADGTVYVGSCDGNLYALDSATGSLKWAFSSGNWVQSSPSIGADGTVYFGSDDNNVYALDGATGNQKWVFTTGGAVESSPAIGADGTVYIGSCDGNIYAISDIPGDLNKDCLVNMADVTIMTQYYHQTGCGIIADLNKDCVVDDADVAILQAHYLESCTQ